VEAVKENIIAVNGTELWVAVQGQGVPLVLCNGGPGSCDYLGPVAAMIDDLIRVYRFEPRGCGRSTMAGPYDVQTCLHDLEALRVHSGHERWMVGGHSWGAFLALAYALEYPDHVIAIVYLAGAGIQDDRQWHAAYQAGRDAERERQPEFAYPGNNDVNRIGNSSSREYIKQPELLRRLATLDVPMLAVQGSDDIRPNWPVEQLVHLMPRAELEIIDGAGHYLWLTHAAQLRERVRVFLAQGGIGYPPRIQ
jgi:proline iminopeptidase